ncbi:MAG: CinA family nicotinamide mononucleotide deamidase-related protein, partial [Anaerolineales bacterium]|nr:CinA family nicotinamide mononucleotide deamidase-related protein [Anaerolineales bacterium]
MKAEVISIGTELLLGEIVDTNAAYIARSLKNIGIDLFFKTTVGDNVERVRTAIYIALDRADVIITTGGLGPTVDDVTRLAVAKATDRELEFRQPLLDQISARFERWGAEMSQNNRQQAYVPAGALPLLNPVGTAPCFIVESDRGIVISLPGVPREMINILDNQVLPYLRKKMETPAVIVTRILRTAGIGESQVDSIIADLEQLSNPTVGLAAHSGQTDIRIAAKAPSAVLANSIIDPLEIEIQKRLGINIYGKGTEQVEDVLLNLLQTQSMTMALVEAGSGGLMSMRLHTAQQNAAYGSSIV